MKHLLHFILSLSKTTLVHPICYLVILSFHYCCAQTTDSIDNIVYKISKEWQTNKQATFKQFTYFNKDKSFCQVAFYNAQPSSGNKKTDFENEWKELVEKNFTVFTLAAPQLLKTKKGNTLQRLGTKGTDKNGKSYYVQLNVFDCNNSIQSVLVVSGTQQQMQQYDSLWQSLIVSIKKENTLKTTTASTTNAVPPADKVFTGSWGKSYSTIGAYSNDMATNLAFSGYKKGQYNFKTDGTYTFQGENWGGQINSNKFRLKNEKEYGLIDEMGNFYLTGTRLTIIPTKNIYRIVDKDGNLLRTGTLGLAKREYSWQTYYAPGMEETRLVLAASKVNDIDGDYSTYEPAVSYPNSFCYSLGKNLFFKFLPMILVTSASISANESILGKWAKSASGPPQYQNGVLVNLVNSGYYKGQYEFKTDGSYTFHGEAQYSTNSFGLIDETGTYSLQENQLTFIPSNSKARQVDLNGALKKTESLSLSKRIYTWQTHYFEGINETNLVLTGEKENMVDGGFAGNSNFPNSFLYSREFIPEWRFKIQ